MADANKVAALNHLTMLGLRCSASSNAKILELTNSVAAALEEIDETKQDNLTFDSTPIEGSTNPVTSDGIYKAIGDIGSILDSINGEVV